VEEAEAATPALAHLLHVQQQIDFNGFMVTLGRFELPTCGLGNRIDSLCIGMHGYALR
jgi:hypothetical protein